MPNAKPSRSRPRSKTRARGSGLDSDVFQERFEAMVANVSQVIRGKGDVIRLALTALLANGHVLFEDMPGTGKTMLARSISETINADASRIQCTPDLLPSDLTGSPVLDRKTGDFVFRRGPVFANVLLADEINRATPKTQSALLEAMGERNVTVDGVTHPLPAPFFVLATQNPVEQAGTFPLPEAQLDRFLFKLSMGYVVRDAEVQVLRVNRGAEAIDDLKAVIDIADVVEMVDWCNGINVAEPVEYYIVDLVQATRSDPMLQMGASSRAALALMRASRVLAAAQGRDDVVPDDVARVAIPVIGHRLILTPDALLRDETVNGVIERILTRVKVPLGVGGKRSAEALAEVAMEAGAAASPRDNGTGGGTPSAVSFSAEPVTDDAVAGNGHTPAGAGRSRRRRRDDSYVTP